MGQTKPGFERLWNHTKSIIWRHWNHTKRHIMDFVWSQSAIKKKFPNDLGIAPALMKHVSDRFELILIHFKLLVNIFYDFFNVAIIAILWHCMISKFRFMVKTRDSGDINLYKLAMCWKIKYILREENKEGRIINFDSPKF